MMHVRWLVLFVALPVLMMALIACNDDDDGEAPTATEVSEPLPTAPEDADPDAEPVQIEVTAQNISFTPDVIAAPAAVPFTIVLDNLDDRTPHNIAIFLSESQAMDGGDPLFATEIEAGPISQELSVTPLLAADYFVWCQIHTSQMTATLNVE